MRIPVKLRTLTAEEATEIKRLASSRKKPIRLVQRARILAYMMEETNLYASEAVLKAGFSSTVTGPVWVHRFNANGLAGLEDQPRKGRMPTHGAEVHSKLVRLATQKPKTLGYPFQLWTLERLQSAFLERQGRKFRFCSPKVCLLVELDRTLVEAIALPGAQRKAL